MKSSSRYQEACATTKEALTQKAIMPEALAGEEEEGGSESGAGRTVRWAAQSACLIRPGAKCRITLRRGARIVADSCSD
jgi:hypothetical protein